MSRKAIRDNAYCTLLFIAVFYSAIRNSLISLIVRLPYTVIWVLLFGGLFFCIPRSVSKKELRLYMLSGVGILIGFASYMRSGSHVLINIIIYSLGARTVDYKKIIKTYRYGILLAMLLVAGAELLGLLPHIRLYYREMNSTNDIRYTFGFTHPNVFACYLLAFVFTFYFNQKEHIKVKQLLPCITGLILAGRFSKSYTVFLTMFAFLLLAAAPLYNRLYNLINRYNKSIRYIFVVILIALIIFIVRFASMNSDNEFLTSLGSTAASRLLLANRALREYGSTIIGQRIVVVNSLEVNALNYDYFTVDSLPVLLVVRDGLLVSLCFWGWVIATVKKAVRGRYLYAIFITILLMLFSIMESGFSFLCFGYVFAFLLNKETALTTIQNSNDSSSNIDKIKPRRKLK